MVVNKSPIMSVAILFDSYHRVLVLIVKKATPLNPHYN